MLAYAWAGPCTLLGALLAACVGLFVPLRWRVIAGVCEVSPKVPVTGRVPGGFAAVTLGHIVLGASATELNRLRTHERVHVAQFERWGPLLLLAYPLAGAWCWALGGSAYADNPFEREALAVERMAPPDFESNEVPSSQLP